MNDRKLIFDYLDDNYGISYGHIVHHVVDKVSRDSYSRINLKEILYKIFGEYTTDEGVSNINVLNDWFEVKEREFICDFRHYLSTYDGDRGIFDVLDEMVLKFGNNVNQSLLKSALEENYVIRFIEPKLRVYLHEMNMDLGGIKLYDKLTLDFKRESPHSWRYISKEFYDYYRRMFIRVLDSYIEKNTHAKSVDDFIVGFDYRLYGVDYHEYLETGKDVEFSAKYLSDWYNINILDDKLIELFRDFVITVGRTNWVVTWVGHGVMTDERLLKEFKNDNKKSNEFISRKYDEWYYHEVESASERVIKRNFGLNVDY